MVFYINTPQPYFDQPLKTFISDLVLQSQLFTNSLQIVWISSSNTVRFRPCKSALQRWPLQAVQVRAVRFFILTLFCWASIHGIATVSKGCLSRFTILHHLIKSTLIKVFYAQLSLTSINFIYIRGTFFSGKACHEIYADSEISAQSQRPRRLIGLNCLR